MQSLSQLERLNNFIVNELQDSGCWATAHAKPSDLAGPIHPLYCRKRWAETLARDPGQVVGGGGLGRWEVGGGELEGLGCAAACVEVGDKDCGECAFVALVSTRGREEGRGFVCCIPLQMAVAVADGLVYLRLDALFDGERIPIDEAAMQDEPDLTGKQRLAGPATFWRRSVLQQWTGTGTTMAQETEQHLFDLSFHINLGFSGKKEASVLHGFHVPRFKGGENKNITYHSSEIYLCIWQLEPLLLSNLSASERIIQTFACAKTVSLACCNYEIHLILTG